MFSLMPKSKKKVKANVSTSVIFKADPEEHPKIAEVSEDGEAAAIVTRSSRGDWSEVNLHVFVNTRGPQTVLNVPHSNHAEDGVSSWKHR